MIVVLRPVLPPPSQPFSSTATLLMAGQSAKCQCQKGESLHSRSACPGRCRESGPEARGRPARRRGPAGLQSLAEDAGLFNIGPDLVAAIEDHLQGDVEDDDQAD